MPPIYLDNNSTTRVDPRVTKAMLPYWSDDYGNAASVTHFYGNRASKAVDEARKQIASLIHAASRNIVLTSGATEANNLAILGVMRKYGPGSHLIVTAAEHKAVLDPANHLVSEGYEVTTLPVDDFGMVSPDEVAAEMRPNTKLVSVIAANNEVGSINPINEIAEVCHESDVLFHTDATQLIGKQAFDAKSVGVDLASFSAHKLYGPKGVGALFIRRGLPKIKLEPLMFGGGHEKGLRSGTLPVPLIVGFGAACEICLNELSAEGSRLCGLRDELVNQLKSSIDRVVLNGHPDNRIPGNASLSFEAVNSEALMSKLNDHIAVSSGSACTTANPEPSHVLIAMGFEEARIRSTIRFGLGRFNTEEELEEIVQSVSIAVTHLRRISVG